MSEEARTLYMTALELHRWLRSLHEVAEPSVDRIIVGAPETVIRGIAVVWMPTWDALRNAAEQGLNVVVAHEPTFFSHHDLDGLEAAQRDLPPRARAALEDARDAKRRWIEAERIVVIRCHDVLDAMPGGVVDSLAEQLGFGAADYVASWRGYRVVRLPSPVTAANVAQRLAKAFAVLGQPGVGFYGDRARVVKTLGLGTGFGCEPWRFVELGAGMALTIDDRIKTWVEGEWASDSGFPLAVINHGTSEEWGVRQLARRLKDAFPALSVELIPQGCGYRWVEPR
jgi:putative NIF3 family GTP cyclohydrolase 1 type 2